MKKVWVGSRSRELDNCRPSHMWWVTWNLFRFFFGELLTFVIVSMMLWWCEYNVMADISSHSRTTMAHENYRIKILTLHVVSNFMDHQKWANLCAKNEIYRISKRLSLSNLPSNDVKRALWKIFSGTLDNFLRYFLLSILLPSPPDAIKNIYIYLLLGGKNLSPSSPANLMTRFLTIKINAKRFSIPNLFFFVGQLATSSLKNGELL